MQKICSKCGTETNDDGDLHCRKILQTETRRLLLDGKVEEARRFFSQVSFDEDFFKERMFDLLCLEPEIQPKIQQERQQRRLMVSQMQNQFATLAKKYSIGISELADGFGPTLLILILIKLDKAEILDKSELEWLEENKKFKLLANYYYQLFVNFPGGNDGWNLAKACKFFRMAGMPEKAIEITNGFSEKIIDHGADAAIYTSRGAAFRRLPNRAEAKRCANKAISLPPKSFYPYNLLGGISYDEGSPEEGDKYFEKASELGSPPRMQEAEIRSALQHTEAEAKNHIIAYLLQKDPEKYAWVKQFQTN